MAVDPDIAWQVETLRQTVQLLHELPRVPLPRSFALTEAQVADVLAQRRSAKLTSLAMGPSAARPMETLPKRATLWQRMSGFFQVGNPVWRNAAAVAAVLFLILLVGDPTRFSSMRSQPPVSQSAPVESIAMEAPTVPAQKLPAPKEIAPTEAQPALAVPVMEAGAIPTTEPAAEAVPAAQEPADLGVRSLKSEAPAEPSTGPAAVAAEAVTQEETAPAAADTAPVAAAALPTQQLESVAPSKEGIAEPEARTAGATESGPAETQAEGAEQEAAPLATVEGEAVAQEPAVAQAQEEARPAEVAPAPANRETQTEPGENAGELRTQTAEEPTSPQSRWTLAAVWAMVRWVLLGLAIVFAGLWWQSRRAVSAG